MEQRLSLVTLGVADLDRALRFYEALGWRRANKNAEVVFFQLNGMVLALWDHGSLAADARLPAHGSGFGGIALAYCARSRAEVDAVLEEAKQAGGRVLKPAEDAFWGGYSGYFADPDGHPWEVAWNPEWEPDGGRRRQASLYVICGDADGPADWFVSVLLLLCGCGRAAPCKRRA